MQLYNIIKKDIETSIALRKIGKHKNFAYLGIPGIGKTAIIEELAQVFNLELWGDMVLSSLTPMDITAKVPDMENQILESFPNSNIPLEEFVGDKWVLWFIDEATNGTSDVWKAMQQGLLSHKFGGKKLGPNVLVFAAGNRQADKAGAGVLTTAVYNRFKWRTISWDASMSDDAMKHILSKHIPENPEDMSDAQKETMGIIEGYFSHKPLLESDFTEALKKLGKSDFVQWASPRSVEAMINAIAVNNWRMPDTMDMEGDIGIGRATELSSFAAYLGKMTKFEDLIQDPAKAKLPDSVEATYAMIAMLAARMDVSQLGVVWGYVKRIRETSMRAVFVKMAMRKYPELRETAEYRHIYKTDKDLVAAINQV